MTPRVRPLAKRLAATTLFRAGAWALALRRWAWEQRTVVLTYHRVIDKLEPALDYSQPGMIVTAPTLEWQLAFLERHFEIVALGTLLDGDAGRRPARRPRCAITFDDGWRDNHELALPIFRRRGLPATIFLTTDFVGSRRAFWHTELIYVLLHADAGCLRDATRMLEALPAGVREVLIAYTDRPHAAGAEGVDTIVETVKAACDEAAIQVLVDALAHSAGLRRPFFPGRRFFLDWDQVREMAGAGFEIGSHGCSHRIMTRLSSADAERELSESRAEIERQVGLPVRHFAFPNEDTSAELMRAAARAGYRTACGGTNADAGGLRILHRLGMHEGVGAPGSPAADAMLALSLLRVTGGAGA